MSIGAVSATTATSPQSVDPTRTPVTRADLRAALGRAYQSVTGKTASSTLLDNLTAQASLETGGGAQMFNYNFGGIKGESPTGQTAQCMTHEVVGGKELTVRQGFRAYGSIDAGAEDYVHVLRKNFGVALGRAELPDVAGFAHALKQAGYYTANESDYANALRSQTGTTAATQLGAAPAAPTLDTFFSSASLTRICNALSESALRIASPEKDSSGA
jgi:flagellar protein FlgJ